MELVSAAEALNIAMQQKGVVRTKLFQIVFDRIENAYKNGLCFCTVVLTKKELFPFGTTEFQDEINFLLTEKGYKYNWEEYASINNYILNISWAE